MDVVRCFIIVTVLTTVTLYHVTASDLDLHELTSRIWQENGANHTKEFLEALDAILVVLNSKKLHSRQAPNTCPFCPSGYPCAQGCPTAPLEQSSCQNCSSVQYIPKSTVEEPSGPPGPPGPAGTPGYPVMKSKKLQGCPGPHGPPGECSFGLSGLPGKDGLPGTCPKRPPTVLRVDTNEMQNLIRQHLNCQHKMKCRYATDELMHRMLRLEAFFRNVESYQSILATLGRYLAALKITYRGKLIQGQPGPVGPRGETGNKGYPGYEGISGQCTEERSEEKPIPGAPGKPGPKGEEGVAGDKICDCPGDVGEPGSQGLSTEAASGSKGIKGEKGFSGRDSNRPPAPSQP